MNYDELSDAAKSTARDKFREWVCQDDWWEHIYEDAIACGKLIGIEVAIHTQGNHTKPDIWFQLSYSQGDGCCWGGWFSFKDMVGAAARIKAQAPQDTTLHALGEAAEIIHREYLAAWTAAKLKGEEDDFGPMTPTVAVTAEERYWRSRISVDDGLTSWEGPLQELANDFANWIHNQLEAESDYQHADEQIEETIRSGDYDFDEDGRL